MFAIGGMPKETPLDIRRASLRGSVRCGFNAETAKEIADELGISAQDVLSGNIPADRRAEMGEYSPYFNLKYARRGSG
jgi:hypothetical protein